MKAEHQTSATSSPSGINASDVLSIPAGMEGTAYLDLNFTPSVKVMLGLCSQ